MKKKFFSLSLLAAGLLAMSCSNDLEKDPAVTGGDHTITFKTWSNKTLQTRARAVTTASTISDFAVLAINPVPGATLIDGLEVTGNPTWTYGTSPAYWPDVDPVNFYAYSPSAAAGVTNSGSGSTTALTGQTETAGQPGLEFELPTTIAAQEDLLVSRHTGTYASEGTTGVPLNFHHALSRIKFEAKSESSQAFVVRSIVLKNLKGKATLDLNGLPADDATFPYPINDATLTSAGYQTYWVPDGSTIISLTADLTDGDVAGDLAYHEVVGNDDAIYVITQTNVKNSDYPYSTKLAGGAGSGSSTDFYIEITYAEDNGGGSYGNDITYAVPVKAIVGSNPDASSLAFEIERQYTFRFELSGSKPIVFKDITVCDYDEVAPFPTYYTATADGSLGATSTKIDFEFDQDVTGLLATDITISAG